MSDDPRKVLRIKNDNDSYIIKMYDGTTYGSYSQLPTIKIVGLI